MTLRRGLLLLLAILMLIALVAVVLLQQQMRQGMAAYDAHLAPPAQGPGLRATWFGVTGVLLDDGAHAIFIDPFFTRPPGLLNMALNREIAPDPQAIDSALAAAGIQRLDAVLVSHSHFDHSMDAGIVAAKTGALLLGSESTLNIGRGDGLPEAQLQHMPPGVPLQVGPYRITFIESRHAGATGGTPTGEITQALAPPAHYLDYKLGGAYSILIEHRLGRVLHHGSAGHVAGALQGQQADVVLLGVALVDDWRDYLHEVVDSVGARRVIPTHWDDFTRPLQPPRPFPLTVRLDRFFDYLQQQRPDLQVQTFTAGQPMLLFAEQ